MKISVSEQTARKALAVLPTTTEDQDLRQLRERLEQGLKNVTAAGTLTPDELDALIGATRHVLRQSSPATVRLNDQLNTAIPKLEALLARRTAEATDSRG